MDKKDTAIAIIKELDSLSNYFDENKQDNGELLGELADEIMPFLDQLILSILDKLATKIEEETYTENREEDSLVEHIVNEIRKFIPEPLILLRAILTNKGDK